MNVFDLSAKLTLDTSEYEKGLSGAEKSASGFGGKLGTAAKVGGAALAAIGTAAVAAAGAVANATKQTAEYGDNIDKMSQKLGLSAEAYQKWDYVLGQSGADINSMSTGLKTLTNQIDNAKNGSAEAQAKFAALGISMEDLGSMSREEVFEAAISGFQGMADSTERAALANDLFGRSGQELTPLFNTSIEATEELKNAASELGFVMSDDAVKASAAYMDSLDTLQRTIGGIKNTLTAEFMPAVTDVMDGLTMLFSGDEGGIGKIKEGVSNFVSTLSERLPEFVEAGAQILTTIITGLFENLPALLEAGWEILKVLAKSLLELAGSLLEIGWEWILNITQGIRDKISDTVQAGQELWQNFKDNLHEKISEALQQGVEWITNLIQGIKDKISDTVAAGQELWQNLKADLASRVSEMLSQGQEWIENLIQGVKNKISDTVASIQQLWQDVKAKIQEKKSELVQLGRDWIQGLVDGVVAKAQALIDAVGGAVRGAINWAKNLLGIASPSKVFKEIGEYVDKGFAEGIEAKEKEPLQKIKALANEIISIVKDMNNTIDAELVKTVSDVAYVANMDYSAAMLKAENIEEFQGLAKLRDAKIAGEGIDLSAQGWKSNDDLLKEWQESLDKQTAAIKEIGTAKVMNDRGEYSDIHWEQPINLQVNLDGKVIGEAAYKYNKLKTRMVGA